MFTNAQRIQGNALAKAEKQLLILIAQRLPQWIHSDHLTALSFISIFLAGCSYAMLPQLPFAPLIATWFLFWNWFGDSLDGTVARVRNRQRPRYGFYVDHIADTFGMLFLMAGLAVSQVMHAWVAAAFLITYFLISIDIFLATYTIGDFRLSFGVLGPTEMRILLAIGNLFLLFRPRVDLFGRELFLFDIGFGSGAVVLLLLAITSAIRNIRILYRAEQIQS